MIRRMIATLGPLPPIQHIDDDTVLLLRRDSGCATCLVITFMADDGVDFSKLLLQLLHADRDGVVSLKRAFVPMSRKQFRGLLTGLEIRLAFATLDVTDLPNQMFGEDPMWGDYTASPYVDVGRLIAQVVDFGCLIRPTGFGFVRVNGFQEHVRARQADKDTLIGRVAGTSSTSSNFGELCVVLGGHPDGEIVRDIVRAEPWIAARMPEILRVLSKETLGDAPVSIETLTGAINLSASTGWKVSPRVVKRCRSFYAAPRRLAPSVLELGLLSALPASWLKPSTEDLEMLSAIAHILQRMCPDSASAAARLLGASGGDYYPFLDRLFAGIAPRDRLGTMLTAPRFGHIQIGLVMCADAVEIVASGLVERCLGAPAGPVIGPAIARQLMIGDGGLARLYERTRVLHNWGRQWMDRAMADAEPVNWKKVIPDFSHGAYSVVELTSQKHLADAGLAFGNCIGFGTYARRALLGTSRIVAVYEGDDVISLAEVEGSGPSVVIAQHEGPGNHPAPERAIAVLAAWKAAIASGALVVAATPPAAAGSVAALEALPGGGGWRQRLGSMLPAAPAEWRGVLQGRYASMGFVELGGVIAGMLARLHEQGVDLQFSEPLMERTRQ